MKMAWGVGVIIAVLLPIALFFFGALNGEDTIAAILVLNGLWSVAFGLAFAGKDRMFYAGWGLVVAILATFAFLPWQYTIGLVLVAAIVLVLAQSFMKPSTSTRMATQPVAPAAG